MLLKLHVADDFWPQRPSGVRKHGRAESRMKFLGDGCAANLSTALQDKRLESGTRQIKRGDQSVVTTADDYDVARIRHQRRVSAEALSRTQTLSFRPEQNDERSDSFCAVEEPAVCLRRKYSQRTWPHT